MKLCICPEFLRHTAFALYFITLLSTIMVVKQEMWRRYVFLWVTSVKAGICATIGRNEAIGSKRCFEKKHFLPSPLITNWIVSSRPDQQLMAASKCYGRIWSQPSTGLGWLAPSCALNLNHTLISQVQLFWLSYIIDDSGISIHWPLLLQPCCYLGSLLFLNKSFLPKD